MRRFMLFKLKFLLSNFLSLFLEFPRGFLDVFVWILYGRKKIIVVKLFSRKFGHFLMNTESFLVDLGKPSEDLKVLYFLDKMPYDNHQLKKVWSEHLTMRPFGRLIAWSFIANWDSRIQVVDYPVTWSQSGALFKADFGDSYFYRAVRKKVNYSAELMLKSDRPIVAITVRHSSYQANAMSGSLQSWRDNDLSVVNQVTDSLTSSGFQVVLANNIPDLKIRKFLSSNLVMQDWSLIQQAKLFERAKFVLCGATGVDWIPLMQGCPAVLYNWQLGTSFPSIIVRSKSILVPQKVFNIGSNRFLDLKEYVALLKKIETEYGIDRLEDDVQLALGVRTIHPNSSEIMSAVRRLEGWMSDDRSIDIRSIRDSWNGYPRVWNHMTRDWLAYDKRRLRSYLQFFEGELDG